VPAVALRGSGRSLWAADDGPPAAVRRFDCQEHQAPARQPAPPDPAVSAVQRHRLAAAGTAAAWCPEQKASCLMREASCRAPMVVVVVVVVVVAAWRA
jgi:hypothetical protein